MTVSKNTEDGRSTTQAPGPGSRLRGTQKERGIPDHANRKDATTGPRGQLRSERQRVDRADSAGATEVVSRKSVAGGIVRQLLDLANGQIAAIDAQIESAAKAVEELQESRVTTKQITKKLEVLLTELASPADE